MPKHRARDAWHGQNWSRSLQRKSSSPCSSKHLIDVAVIASYTHDLALAIFDTFMAMPLSIRSWFDEREHPAFRFGTIAVPTLILPIFVCFALIFTKIWQYTNMFLRRERPPKLLPPNHSLITELARITAFLIPFGTAFVITSYLTSCIGWRSILGTGPAVPPSIQGGLVGAMLFPMVWIAMAYWKRDRDRAFRIPSETLIREVQFDAEVVGWVMIMEILGWILVRARLVVFIDRVFIHD